MATLIVRRGFNKGAAYRLGQRSLTLGRDQGNMIQLIDDGVSRRHAFLRWTGIEHVIQDLQSHNGIVINGQRVTEAPLRAGDKIEIGGTELEMTGDLPGAADAVLGRKVVDKGIVGAETKTKEEAERTPKEILAAGGTVDVDRQVDRWSVLASRFLAELLQATQKKAPPNEIQQLAARGVGRLIQPDRCFLLKVTPERKFEHCAWALDPTLDAARGKAPVHMEGIKQIVIKAAPLRENRLADQPGAAFPLGSMAGVPIVNGGRVVGVLYLDSFGGEARQSFVDGDMELLSNTAKLLGGTFEA